MSPAETRKNQILKFQKLSPLDRLLLSLEAGKEMFSMLPPPKKNNLPEVEKCEKNQKEKKPGKTS